MNIYQRINEVRKAVGYVQKDAAVQGYKAVTHDQVTAVIRSHLVKHGIVIAPRQTASEVTDVGRTQKGATIIRYAGWYEIDFVNIEEPGDKVTVPIEAHANDQGDKAPGKALSYATKYAVLKLFSFETGENEEGRVQVEQPTGPITDEQAHKLMELIDATDTDHASFLRWIYGGSPPAEADIANIPASAYPKAEAALKTKLKKAHDNA